MKAMLMSVVMTVDDRTLPRRKLLSRTEGKQPENGVKHSEG